jgi:hypothetical protein
VDKSRDANDPSSAQTGLSVAIPDNNATGITRSFDLSAFNLRVEQVTLTLSATHASRGNLAVTLTSPSGMVSRLAERYADTGDHYSAWTFSNVRCWGENSQGIWTLRVSDLTSGMAFTDQCVNVSSVAASDPEGLPVTLAYQWQQTADNLTFTNISGVTNASLALSETLAGHLVRCRITPSAGGQNGAAFITSTVAVNRRPARWARVGSSYIHDSELFLASSAITFGRELIIIEVSQGKGGSKEWVELLVLKTSDLRGCMLADRTGTYTTFANVALWSAVTPGTWGGLSNANADSIIIKNPASQIIDALSLNNENVYDPKLASVGSTMSEFYTGDTEPGADNALLWTIGNAHAAKPGAGNGGINTTFVTNLRNGAFNVQPQFRLGSTGDAVPSLSIQATSGLFIGIATAAGLYQVVIERFLSSEIVSHSIPLLVLDVSGSGIVPTGKTWTLDAAVTLPSSLTVQGTVNMGSYALVIPGTLALPGMLLNLSGTLSYLKRTGALPPGQIALVSNPVNDAADDDGDGLANLIEFSLGTDPSSVSTIPMTSQITSGHLEFTLQQPAGITGVSTIIEVSDDLSTWESGPGHTQVISNTTSSAMRTLVVRDEHTGAQRFIRLRVTR